MSASASQLPYTSYIRLPDLSFGGMPLNIFSLSFSLCCCDATALAPHHPSKPALYVSAGSVGDRAPPNSSADGHEAGIYHRRRYQSIGIARLLGSDVPCSVHSGRHWTGYRRSRWSRAHAEGEAEEQDAPGAGCACVIIARDSSWTASQPSWYARPCRGTRVPSGVRPSSPGRGVSLPQDGVSPPGCSRLHVNTAAIVALPATSEALSSSSAPPLGQ